MKTLYICPEQGIPLDVATQTVAIVARKRVGKTYTASVLAEELIKKQIPIVVLDPTGAWWGLRASADGKREGFPVVIIGGEHGDLPLEETAGKVIADLVVDHPGYYVIDFSKFEHDAQIHRFATEFGKRFYFRKEQHRFPVQLIIDEADVVAPQKPQPNQTVMLHTYDNIVRRGGIRGIGVTMITQRPAVLNKNILTQCETLIILQMSGSQDIDAIEHWMRIHGSDSERKELLQSIPTLQRGEAWLWSPSWLQVCKRIHVRERETFNSSATPKAGEKVIVPQKLADVDIQRLGDLVRATVEKQKENDPAELKKIIRTLETELKVERAKVGTPEIREFSVFTDADLSNIAALRADFKVIRNSMEQLDGRLNQISLAKECHKNAIVIPPRRTMTNQARDLDLPTSRVRSEAGQMGDFGKAEREILTVLGSYSSATKKKIAVCAGYAVSGGSFNNALGKLRSLNLITRGDPIELTEAGAMVAPVNSMPTGENLFQMWLKHPNLGKAERQILQCLWERLGTHTSKEQLAGAAGYEPSGGSFNNALGRLRTLELINRGNPMALAEEFLA